MGVVLVLALVVFSYSVVPLLVRALIDAQAKLTSQERPLVQRVRQSEGTIRLAAWALWTLVLLVVVLGILLGGSHR
jgi:ABC-type Fe3+ transport system permease subunit